MPSLILAIIVIAVVAFVFGRSRGAIAQQPRKSVRKKKNCAWVKTGEAKGRLKEFKCTTCSAVAYSMEPGGPATCKKNFGRGEL